MSNKELTSVLLSGLAVTGSVLATVATGGTAPIAGLIFTGAMAALGGIGGNLLSSYLEKKFVNPTSKDEILRNGDLTRAVGKAIFILINDEANKADYGKFRDIIKHVGRSEGGEWEVYLAERLQEWDKYLAENLDKETRIIDKNRTIYAKLNDLLPAQLTKYIKAPKGKIDDLQSLTPETWAIIVKGIFQSHSYQPGDEDCLKMGERLHQDFPQALRKVLIDDFSADGKAYASMQLRLLSETLDYSEKNYQDNQEIKQKLDALLMRVNEVRWLNDSKVISLDEKFWKDAFDLNKNIESIVSDTAKRVIRIEEKIDRFIELFTEFLKSQANQPASKSQTQKFLPKNFPQSLIYFTGREQVLKNIAEALENHGTAAFADTHGVGKSSVMIEFAYRNKDVYEHILFIRATNNEFNIYVSEIVKDLGFALPEDAKPEQRLAVLQEWLATNQDWLLLVDNVDDVDFIHDCKFNKPNGKVIYTSNDEKIFKVGTKVELPKLNDENAMLLLYKHWQDNANAKFEDIPDEVHAALKGIAEKFGNHPFSMAFVGSYLAEEDESLEEFLEAYQSKEKNLLENYEFLTDYHQKNVATAFLFRFEQISTPKDDTEREQFLSTAVKDYLKLSAFVGTDNIPEELLQQSLANLHPDQAEWTENKDFIKDIYKRFKPTSIFKRDGENKTLTTHRIVQEIMRFQIKDEENTLLKILSEVLNNNFEYFDFINKEKVERYLTHIGIFLEYIEERQAKKATLTLKNEATANLYNNFARYFFIFGQYRKADKYFQLFKNICEENKDIDQNLLAASYNNLAVLYRTLSKYSEAEEYFLKSIEIKKQISTEETEALAISYNQLAWLYRITLEYEKAEFYCLKSIKTFEQINGGSHINNCAAYNNLGLLYDSKGKYKEAKHIFKKALKICKKELVENHPNIATNYSNLAMVNFNIGNLKFAKSYQQKSLKARLSYFGENHPDVAMSYWWLGVFSEKEKRYKIGLNYFHKAQRIFLKFLPKEHPDMKTLQSFIDRCEIFI